MKVKILMKVVVVTTMVPKVEGMYYLYSIIILLYNYIITHGASHGSTTTTNRTIAT